MRLRRVPAEGLSLSVRPVLPSIEAEVVQHTLGVAVGTGSKFEDRASAIGTTIVVVP